MRIAVVHNALQADSAPDEQDVLAQEAALQGWRNGATDAVVARADKANGDQIAQAEQNNQQARELLANWENYELPSPIHPGWGRSEVEGIVSRCGQ